MIELLLVLATTPGVAQCLSAHEAEAAGLTQQTLDARYSPALEEWPEEADTVSAAWGQFTRPLHSIEDGVSLAAYFAPDGSIDLVIVRTDDERRVRQICQTLSQLDTYRWPLISSRPFRQCGSVVASPRRGDFSLTVRLEEGSRCVGSPIPVQIILENISPTPHQMWIPKDGTLNDDVSISLKVNGEDMPTQLLDPSIAGPFVVIQKEIKPGSHIEASLDLAEYLLPGGEPLGRSPGDYVLYADILKQGGEGTWTGIVWSKPFLVTIRKCN